MKLSALRAAVSCALLFAMRLGAGQTVALTLSSVEAQADNTVRLKLLLHGPSGSAPAALQWIFILPPGVEIVEIEAGKAVKDAGKTLVCNGAKCLVYGLNRTRISNGPIAVLKIKVDGSLAAEERSALLKNPAQGPGRTRTPEIQIGDLIAVSLEGNEIPVVAGNSLVSATKIP